MISARVDSAPLSGGAPVWAAALAVLVHAWLLSSGEPNAYWAGAVSAALFTCVQLLVPEARLDLGCLLGPRGWTQFVFFLQLVLLPLWISVFGPALATLPKMPATSSINGAIILTSASYLSFTLGGVWTRRRQRRPLDTNPPRRQLVLGFLAIGLLGLSLRYSSPAEVFSSLGDPTQLTDLTSQEEGTLRGAAGSFLRPFLLTAIVMLWSGSLAGLRGRGFWPLALRSAAAIAGIFLVGATYNLNRSAFLVPLIAMAAAFSLHVRRLSVARLAAGALVLGAVSLFVGVYRGEAVSASELAADVETAGVLAEKVDADTVFQVYAMAPQFLAFLLESDEEARGAFKPETPLASLLSPLPIIGKPWRDDSGTSIYNTLIYGSADIVDQLIPCQGEVYLSLTAVGFFFFYAGLGVILSALQEAFEGSRSPFGAYAAQYLAIWLNFLVMGSLGSVSQILIYFCLPLYLYWLLNRRWQGAYR